MNIATAVATARVHREVEFIRRYDQLMTFSQKLIGSDRSFAQDVVHDAFVQFMQSNTDFGSIDNLDHYLHKVVRNVYRSHLRQRVTHKLEQLSEIGVNEASGSHSDPQKEIQARNLLVILCRYMCKRKDYSIASSVLVLRFLLGYYPEEVAKVARRSRGSVDGLLKSARGDLKKYLQELPLSCVNLKTAPDGIGNRATHSTSDTFGVSRILFESRKGKCFESQQLQKIYFSANARLSRIELSHMVSCPRCLDKTNLLLRIPLLRERSPIDVLSKVPIVLSSLLFLANFGIFDLGFLQDGVEALSNFF
jgi:RNA polymerase sigma factor (sigma-70 family)